MIMSISWLGKQLRGDYHQLIDPPTRLMLMISMPCIP